MIFVCTFPKLLGTKIALKSLNDLIVPSKKYADKASQLPKLYFTVESELKLKPDSFAFI